jgi:hypothetical protein
MLRRRKQAAAALGSYGQGNAIRALHQRLLERLPARFLQAPAPARLIDLLELTASSRLLHLGPGGEFGRWLVQAVDGRRCVTAFPGTAVHPDVVAWPGALPFPEASFSAVFAPDFIRRLNDDELYALLAEARRVVVAGGPILLLDYAPVRSKALERSHGLLVGGDRRGWERLALMVSEMPGFAEAELVDAGPCLYPPIPRVAVRLRKCA